MIRMAPPPRPRAGHERWLVSYADFVTLLFAFFVVLYANSKTDQRRAHLLADSFRAAIGDSRSVEALARLIPHDGNLPTQAYLTALHRNGGSPDPGADSTTISLLPAMADLNKALAQQIKERKLEIRMERRGMVISLRDSSFFPSAGETILPAARPALAEIGKSLRALPNAMRMEGHTDSVPIHNQRFRSNWELSAARGVALMEMFDRDFGIPRERMSIAGFAETVPLASNDSPEGRARNRRVDIVVLTVEAALGQPGPAQQIREP